MVFYLTLPLKILKDSSGFTKAIYFLFKSSTGLRLRTSRTLALPTLLKPRFSDALLSGIAKQMAFFDFFESVSKPLIADNDFMTETASLVFESLRFKLSIQIISPSLNFLERIVAKARPAIVLLVLRL